MPRTSAARARTVASRSIWAVNVWYMRSVSSSATMLALVTFRVIVRQSPGKTSASRSMPARATAINDTRSEGESDNRAAVSTCSIASLGVGRGSNGSRAGSVCDDATKLRSNRSTPALTRSSAMASSSVDSIWLISACLWLKWAAGQSLRTFLTRSTISSRLAGSVVSERSLSV